VVGARDRNLRSGDVHEDLGLLLLKAVALVAPIPRTEDVGADALATLLRPEGARELVAEDSFLVQVKAPSVQSIKYSTTHAVRWLTRLEIPFFIASIDVSTSSIALYPAHRISQVLLEGAYREMHLHLDRVDEGASPPDVRYVNLGPPALTWSTSDLRSRDFSMRAYAILKSHISHQRRNIQLRSIGRYDIIRWDENQPPTCEAGTMTILGSQGNRSILESTVPPLGALILEMVSAKRYEDLPVIASFMEMLRRQGVDPDPGGTLMQMALLLADGNGISEEDIVYLRSLGIPGQLNLTGTRITDSALAYVPPTTEFLSLARTQVSDPGMKLVRRLSGLKRLNVSGTNVTDVGVRMLESLPGLEWLNVAGTRVTEAGTGRLQEMLPSLTIVR